MQPPDRQQHPDRPRVIAHRGASGHAPENTLAAFDQAVTLGADALELDVRLSADGEVVVIHDPTVERTTEGRGPVAEMPLAKLKALDAGYRFSDATGNSPFRDRNVRIPTLDEVFEAHPDTPVVIEPKRGAGSGLPDALASVIRNHRAEQRVVVASSCPILSTRFRQLMPEVRTGFSQPEVRNLYLLRRLGLQRLCKRPADALMIPERYGPLRLVTAGFVEAARALGLELHVWTVNEPADMRRLLELGVNGLVTNYPDRMLEVLGAQVPPPRRSAV